MIVAQLYSVDQVADLLGLHVKTVRNYVRDGRLNAVRIGKQYRIAREDLEAFTGQPVGAAAREDARRLRHAEVSSIVQIDAIGFDEMSRLSTLITASATGRPDDDQPLRIQTLYDEERASLKIILIGGLDSTAAMLKLVTVLLEQR
jgi:excisionase family DNA binding protein